MQSTLPTSANGMPPPSAITKGCSESHPRRRGAVPRLRFGQDDVRFELRVSKVRFADHPEVGSSDGRLLRSQRLHGFYGGGAAGRNDGGRECKQENGDGRKHKNDRIQRINLEE
jgi:hypothetical protein